MHLNKRKTLIFLLLRKARRMPRKPRRKILIAKVQIQDLMMKKVMTRRARNARKARRPRRKRKPNDH